MKDNYLCIDIGGTNLKTAIIDQSGKILTKKLVTTPKSLKLFIEQIEILVVEAKSSVRGIAICAPGKVDEKTGTIYFGGSLPFLDGVSLKSRLQDKYSLPVVVINDGKSAALAELWLGNLKDVSYGAAITLGTGIGGGIIVEGSLLQGAHFQAGELSFMSNQSSNPSINNLFGSSASAVGLIRKISKVLGFEDLTNGKKVFESINNKNNKAYPIFQEFCREVAYLIANIQAVVDLEKIVIGGGISAQKIVITEIQNQYKILHDSVPIIKKSLTMPTIGVCKFQNEANLLGVLYRLLLELDIETNP